MDPRWLLLVRWLGCSILGYFRFLSMPGIKANSVASKTLQVLQSREGELTQKRRSLKDLDRLERALG